MSLGYTFWQLGDTSLRGALTRYSPPKKNPLIDIVIVLSYQFFFYMLYVLKFSNCLFHFVHFITLNDFIKNITHLSILEKNN